MFKWFAVFWPCSDQYAGQVVFMQQQPTYAGKINL